jgi:hypothetical protein
MGDASMNQHIDINIHPFEIPQIWYRQMAIEQYARNYVDHAYVHGDVKEYCTQAALDLKDPSARADVRREIRKLQRTVTA